MFRLFRNTASVIVAQGAMPDATPDGRHGSFCLDVQLQFPSLVLVTFIKIK